MKLLVCLLPILLFGCDNQDNSLALGTLERDRIAHTATSNEVIIELPVAAGTSVTKGTVIVKFDDTHQKALVAKATAEVALAQANLEKLRHGAREEEVAAASAKVAGAKAELTEAQASYKRQQNLIKDNLTSKAALNAALAKRDTKQASLNAVKKTLQQLTNGTRIEDLHMAEANLAAANAMLASENKKLADLTISSTRDGILDNLPWNLGERATLGSPVAIVLAGKAPFARVYIPETHRINMRIGQELVIHVDGLTTPITGKLRWIAHEPAFTPYYALTQTERSRLMYLAEVQLPDSQAHLPSGIPAQVEMPAQTDSSDQATAGQK